MEQKIEKTLKIGRIPYMVCAPFFGKLPNRKEYSFIEGHPATLNRKLFEGEIDLAPSSSIEYGRYPEKYVLFPDVCTSGNMKVKSVLLVLKENIEDLDGKKIHLTEASETSVALLKVLLKRYLRVEVEWVDTLEKADGRLVIGDEALEMENDDHWNHSYDLAELWAQWKGLPFVFGLWMINEKASMRLRRELALFSVDLKHSLSDFYENLSERLDSWLLEYPVRIDLAVAKKYYSVLDYEFGEKQKLGLIEFYKECKEIGVIGKVPELKFWEPL